MPPNPANAMPFSHWMGVTVTAANGDRVAGTLFVRPDLCTVGDRLHGGAIMALADTLGGIGASLSLPENAKGTTTVESKTNFLSGVAVEETVTAECLPLKRGRRLSVWQTTITAADGRCVAVVIQTQLVL
jgi:1,4-dihydroxy-2-naphthoyl-CoA hydrolase